MKRLFTIIGLACLLLPATLAAKKQVTVINVIPYPQSEFQGFRSQLQL